MPKSYQSTSCLMTSSTCSLLGLPLPLFWRGNWRLFGTPSSLSGWWRVRTGSTYFGDRAFCLWHWGHILLLLFASHLKFLHLNIFFIFIFFSVRAFWIRFCSKTTSPKKVLKEPNRTKCQNNVDWTYQTHCWSKSTSKGSLKVLNLLFFHLSGLIMNRIFLGSLAKVCWGRSRVICLEPP